MKDHGHPSADPDAHHNPVRFIDQIGPGVKVIINNISCCCDEHGGEYKEKKLEIPKLKRKGFGWQQGFHQQVPHGILGRSYDHQVWKPDQLKYGMQLPEHPFSYLLPAKRGAIHPPAMQTQDLFNHISRTTLTPGKR